MHILKSKWLVTVSALIPLVALHGHLAFAGESGVKTYVEERISNANLHFQEIMETNPSQELIVLASFTKPMQIEDAVQEAKASRLTVKGFRHGSSSNSGGYTLAEGEPLDKAIVQYRHDFQFFTDQDLRNTENMLEDPSLDSAVRAALNTRKMDILQRKQKGEAQDLQILGMDLIGAGTDLQQFKQANAFVRVMEIHDGKRKNAAILPQTNSKEEQ